MKDKIISLTLSYPYPDASMVTGPDRYRVDRIINSTEHLPGEFLRKPKVDELCAAKNWHVIITPRADK